jgi:hypothetical protein
VEEPFVPNHCFRIGNLSLRIESEMADLNMFVKSEIGCSGGLKCLKLEFDTIGAVRDVDHTEGLMEPAKRYTAFGRVWSLIIW